MCFHELKNEKSNKKQFRVLFFNSKDRVGGSKCKLKEKYIMNEDW